MSDRNVVPCNGCTACCKNERVILSPEHGDDVASYITVPTRRFPTGNGEVQYMLAHESNGDCIYLTNGGCEIWDRAPWACRRFDCREWYKGFPQADRELLDVDDLDGAVIKAARARL